MALLGGWRFRTLRESGTASTAQSVEMPFSLLIQGLSESGSAMKTQGPGSQKGGYPWPRETRSSAPFKRQPCKA